MLWHKVIGGAAAGSSGDDRSWDIGFASYSGISFSVAAQSATPNDVFFKPDGTKMYVLCADGDDVNEYNLSTPWDISSAGFVQLFSVAAQESTPRGLFFKPDGTKMYVTGSAGDSVDEYNLSTPWDVSTSAYFQVRSVAEDTVPQSLFFKPDGTKMYVAGSSGDEINEYDLSAPWDISTEVFVQRFSVSAQEVRLGGLSFKPDGTKMYIVGDDSVNVSEYSLSAPWDVGSASFVQLFNVAAQDILPTDLFFKPDGTKMYIVGADLDAVYQYEIG